MIKINANIYTVEEMNDDIISSLTNVWTGTQATLDAIPVLMRKMDMESHFTSIFHRRTKVL